MTRIIPGNACVSRVESRRPREVNLSSGLQQSRVEDSEVRVSGTPADVTPALPELPQRSRLLMAAF